MYMKAIPKKFYYAPAVWGSAAGGAAAATWNPADVGTSCVLSNSNLTATFTQPPFGNSGGRATNSHSSGKYYWESHIDTGPAGGGFQVGIATGTWDENSTLNATANGAFVRSGDGLAGYNGSNLFATSAFSNGDVIDVALDLDNSKIWFRLNGTGNWNNSGTDDPATHSGGISISGFSTPAYACVFFGGSTGNAITARFSSASWTGTAPSGFGQL